MLMVSQPADNNIDESELLFSRHNSPKSSTLLPLYRKKEDFGNLSRAFQHAHECCVNRLV